MSLAAFNADELTNLKFNNDIVFYKRLLDKGITRFEGGAREAFELAYDIHMELYEESKVRTLTDQEEKNAEHLFSIPSTKWDGFSKRLGMNNPWPLGLLFSHSYIFFFRSKNQLYNGE